MHLLEHIPSDQQLCFDNCEVKHRLQAGHHYSVDWTSGLDYWTHGQGHREDGRGPGQIQKAGPDCGRGSGAHPQKNFEVLHALKCVLKCVLGASDHEAPFLCMHTVHTS